MKHEIILEDKLYETADALSARFGVRTITIYRWKRRGVLPQPIKIGTRNYYCTVDVEARLTQRS